jgi:hypothetical protein
MRLKRRPVLRPYVDRLDDRCLLSGLAAPTGLSPSQLAQAYGLNAISFTGPGGQAVVGNGAGQTIAIVVAFHDPNLASDLHQFDSTYGLPDPSLTQINLAGSATNDGWAGEATLDVEWAHAIAPGAKILVVEASSDSTIPLLAAVDVARHQPGVAVVSMSWGGPEMANEKQYDPYFTTPAGHQGVTFVAASGDSGSFGGAQWPAVSPNVLSVGGTTLAMNSSGALAGESVWSGSSGGFSRYEPEPAYQRGVQSSGRRSVPDVAFDANPYTGVSVFTTDPSTGLGNWEVVGGTSLGTPAWSAIIAIVDQGLVLGGKGTLDGPTQTLPILFSLPSIDFNIVSASGMGGLLAQTSTLTSTGLGTPKGATLINNLVIGTTRTTGNTTTETGLTTIVGGKTTAGGTATAGGGQGSGGSWWYPGGWWPVFGTGKTSGTGGTSKGKTKPTGGTHKPAPVHGGKTQTGTGSSRTHKTATHRTTVHTSAVEAGTVVVGALEPGFGFVSAYNFGSPVVAIHPSPVAPLQHAPLVVTAIDEVLRDIEARRYAVA